MGYRSDVVLVLTQSSVKILQDKLNALDKDSEEYKSTSSFLEYADKHFIHESDAEVYYWEYIKWYDTYHNVKFIENLLESLKQDEFLFIRIGEEVDDINYQGCFYDNPFGVDLVRNISINEAN